MSDWGTAGITTFVPTQHSTIYPTIDPKTTTFPPAYTVLILGASRGIGAHIAHSYARAGASTIILSSRRVSGLQSVAKECRGINPDVRIEIVPCDIASIADMSALSKTVKEKFERLDNVVVNSGYSGPVKADVADDDMEMVKQVTDVTYLGTYNAAHHLVPLLLSTPPLRGVQKSFLVVGSNATFLLRGPIANTQYCIAKMAQLKLVEMVHEQYSGRGLLTVAVHPGAVRSEMAEETSPKEFLEYCTDDVGLCGGFMVWLTRPRSNGNGMGWLGGRHLVAKWNVEELEGRKDEIVQGDLLKVRLKV